jgi:hypothetical protein
MSAAGFRVVTDHRGSSDPTGTARDATQIAHAGPNVLRATVHKDFYAFQSRATVQVWRDGWQEVIRLVGSDVDVPDATLPELYRLAALVLQPAPTPPPVTRRPGVARSAADEASGA